MSLREQSSLLESTCNLPCCGCELDCAVDQVCLVAAINRRYYSEAEIPVDSSLVLKTSVSGRLPGKRGASGNLELLVLNDQKICGVGNVQVLADLVGNIRELDLAQNNLKDWNEIAQCLGRMPSLSHCNLSSNPLSAVVPSQSFSSCATDGGDLACLSKMNSLVLNGTQISWEALFWLVEAMPNLEELHLSMNDMQTSLIPPTLKLLGNVHQLHVNECNIDSWGRLDSILACFPNLETLIAANNPVKAMTLTEDQAQQRCGCLQSLNINRWQLSQWQDIDVLRYFPMLCELRCLKLPLLGDFNDKERRNLLIARLPGISTLNGSSVDSSQREDAERFFIRYYMNSTEKPKRYAELETIHGQLDPLVTIDFSATDMAKVLIVFQSKKEVRQVDLRQNVGQFKKSLESFVGVPSSKYRVFFKDVEASGIRQQPVMEELRFPRQALFSLRPADGDEFHIQERQLPLTNRVRNSSSGSCSATTTSRKKE